MLGVAFWVGPTIDPSQGVLANNGIFGGEAVWSGVALEAASFVPQYPTRVRESKDFEVESSTSVCSEAEAGDGREKAEKQKREPLS